MMKYSMRVESKTVDTVEGMQNWIELLVLWHCLSLPL